MKDFCRTYSLENLVKENTCFKSTENPSSIDIMLTNKKHCFQNSIVVETGLSDFHKMTVTVMKKFFKKNAPIRKTYHDRKNFDAVKFREHVKFELMTVEDLQTVLATTYLHHAPLKEKLVHAFFISNTFYKQR